MVQSETGEDRAGQPGDEPVALVRIGELARRTGVRAETIRAWERRYEIVSPTRSEGGFRLYSPAQEDRIRSMRDLIAQGVAPAQAAEQVRHGAATPRPSPEPAGTGSPDGDAEALTAALLAYDEETANTVLDRSLGAFSLDVVTGAVILPAMADIGRRWTRGEVSIAQEHFATHVVRGRLLGLARGWGSGFGPRAVLGCPPGELHDIGLIVFGLALRGRGWRVVYLGPDTPVDMILEAARRLDPAAVVLSTTDPALLSAAESGLRETARLRPLWIGGAGAGEPEASRIGARHLPGRPTEAAVRLASEAAPRVA